MEGYELSERSTVIVTAGILTFVLIALFWIWSWPALRGKIADGDNYIWVSIFLIFGAIIYQIYIFYKAIVVLKSKGISNLKLKIPLGATFGGIVLIFLYLIVINLLYNFGSEGVQLWVISNTKNVVTEFNSVFSFGFLWVTIASLIISMMVGLSLLSFFYLGQMVGMLSLIIAFHNYMNGAEFDIGLVLSSLANFDLNEWISWILTILWFAISAYINKSDSTTELQDIQGSI